MPQRLTPPRRRSPAPRLPTAVFEFESAPGVWQQYDPPAQVSIIGPVCQVCLSEWPTRGSPPPLSWAGPT